MWQKQRFASKQNFFYLEERCFKENTFTRQNKKSSLIIKKNAVLF